MAADAVNRQSVRQVLATLCTTAMSGIVDAVYQYERSVITDKTALMVLSSGSQRRPAGINDTRWFNEFNIEVLSFVRKPNTLSGTTGGTNWTEENVEDALDLIDKKLADVIADNRNNTAYWSYIEFANESSVIADGRAWSLQRDQGAVGFKIESRIIKITYYEG